MKKLTRDYRADARLLKASKLAEILVKGEIPATDARRMNAEQWAMAAEAAHVKPPSWMTQRATILIMETLTCTT